MSSKSTIILTSHNEHWYRDGFVYLEDAEGNQRSGITLEFSKANIQVESDDSEDMIITITNPDC